ncbi:hypothetical protein [Vibrio alginolyticus]|uniref:hypothetical protein n=1 Tax=Vibrio alginolyticus TaxID=663 RepID=UPI0006CA9BE1|nr:hypothetical protein [Vibrio alginolyticus]KPM90119.1 hypothetical protein AOR09_03780 [Vibrio alginolyticus]KPM99014.1 hypothetical protein AOG25_06165 [Vibrio alginolyticus]
MTRTHLTKALLDKAMKSLDKMDGWSDKQRCQVPLIMVDKGLLPTSSQSEEEAKRLVERVKAEYLSDSL